MVALSLYYLLLEAAKDAFGCLDVVLMFDGLTTAAFVFVCVSVTDESPFLANYYSLKMNDLSLSTFASKTEAAHIIGGVCDLSFVTTMFVTRINWRSSVIPCF